MLVRENQQVTFGWFVGILEGEGNFHKSEKSTHYFCAITNTDLDIIESCERLLKESNIKCRICEDLRQTKTRYVIRITVKDCLALYWLIEDILECRYGEYKRILRNDLGGSSEIVRGTSIDKDWLIGICEAEGCFCLCKNHNTGIMTPNIIFTNTNQRILEKMALNIRALGCDWRSIITKHERYKTSTQLIISRRTNCRKFLREIENTWQSRRNISRTSLLLELD